MKRFFRAAASEVAMTFDNVRYEPIKVNSLYIGGGTPSLVNTDLLKKWLDTLNSYIAFIPDYEFTIETNPDSVTEEFARTVKLLGVNRIVIGVQSFDSRRLSRLNRHQKVSDIHRAFAISRSAGFENIGLDLIFGWPGQKLQSLITDIERLVALKPEHISLYQLTVESGTRLEKRIFEGEISLPGEETMAVMYEAGVKLLEEYGYKRYEVSNFASEGFHSRHNFAYWKGTPYLGFGPSAHSFVNPYRWSNVSDLSGYIEMIEGGCGPWDFFETLTAEQRFIEVVMLSLRTADGLDKEKLSREYGKKASVFFDGRILTKFISSGYLVDTGQRLQLTNRGFLVADKIIADLIS